MFVSKSKLSHKKCPYVCHFFTTLAYCYHFVISLNSFHIYINEFLYFLNLYQSSIVVY